jgi:hypothetical protein
MLEPVVKKIARAPSTIATAAKGRAIRLITISRRRFGALFG